MSRCWRPACLAEMLSAGEGTPVPLIHVSMPPSIRSRDRPRAAAARAHRHALIVACVARAMPLNAPVITVTCRTVGCKAKSTQYSLAAVEGSLMLPVAASGV